MSLSSLYILPNFLDDRAEVVVNRVKQHSDMKLLTVVQDFELHARLKRLGLNDNQSLNMYDWLQGAINYKDQGINNDARVQNRYDKRQGVLSPVNTNDSSYLNFNMNGETTAKLSYLPGVVARTKSVELLNNDQMAWAKDYYDSRGFLSRRQYFNPDGKLGLELIYHVDGTPVLEISHMGDKQMYRLLGTHGLPNWLLQNELSLMLWWFGQMLKYNKIPANTDVYNDDPFLDAVWPQLTDKIHLHEVLHAQNVTKERLSSVLGMQKLKNANNNFYKILAPSKLLADKLHVDYLPVWKHNVPVDQSKSYSPIRIATVGTWTNDVVVKKLIKFIRAILRKLPFVKIHLVGYFTTDSQKTYDKLIKQHKLEDNVIVHGNLVGKQRKLVLQSCALAWWLPLGDESTVLPSLLNHYGLPVVSTVDRFGATIKEPSADLLSRAVLKVYNNLNTLRQQVVDYPQ